MGTLHRLAAFTSDPVGGNPAGVWVGDALPTPTEMQAIALDVGYSETAFLCAAGDPSERAYTVRYFAPAAEVDFCGHATIAAAVHLASLVGAGPLTLHSAVGPIAVSTRTAPEGTWATLTSVDPVVDDLTAGDLDALLTTFGWDRSVLAPDHPPAVAFAGVWHPVLVLAERDVLGRMSYDREGLGDLMRARRWTTIQLVVRMGAGSYASRNPFPVGGVLEDPATGAAAAAFGAYLRHHGLVSPPARVTITQGEDMGRPSTLTVDVPAVGGIDVSGQAVGLPAP